MLKKSFGWMLFFVLFPLAASTPYHQQIKVWDECTYSMEVLGVDQMELRGHRFEELNASEAVHICEKSLHAYPQDPHVKFLLARAYTKNKQIQKGFSLASEACGQGDIGGCTLLAGFHHMGLIEHADLKKSILLYLWSCSMGDAQACTNLYNAAESEVPYLPKEIKKTEAKMLHLCLQGDYPTACHQYAKDLLRDNNVSLHPKEYEYALSRSCLSGNREGCLLYGELTKKKLYQSREVRRIYIRSCKIGDGESCLRIAHYYGAKKRTEINNITALALYEDTCKRGLSATACRYAGAYYLSNLKGIIRNESRGLKYLEQSCNPKIFHESAPGHSYTYSDMDLYGCRDLVNYYLKTPNNTPKAKRVLAHVCQENRSY